METLYKTKQAAYHVSARALFDFSHVHFLESFSYNPLDQLIYTEMRMTGMWSEFVGVDVDTGKHGILTQTVGQQAHQPDCN